MTQLCYTLEEAAGKLNLSETVLVRLSQTFKVPAVAYETMGYLSFKGDLTFSDEDIRFFKQVKERLLSGESLDEVKSRIRPATSKPAAASRTGSFEESLKNVPPVTLAQPTRQPAPARPVRSAQEEKPSSPLPPVVPMRSMPDRSPLTQAAEESLERYKRKQATGLGRIFEKMMREVNPATQPRRQASRPGPKPLRAKMTQANAKETESPVNVKQPASGIWSRKAAHSAEPAESAWDDMIRNAVHQPRTLDTHLKNAAALLRERATRTDGSRAGSRSQGDLT